MKGKKTEKETEEEPEKTEEPEESLEEISDEEEVEKEKARVRKARREFNKEGWKPKTKLGQMVKGDEKKDIKDILSKGMKISEAELVDVLVPDIETDLLLIGQAKGKFGGGQRRVFRQTQKKTREGNKPKFSTLAVVGNRDGLVGVGFGKAKETVPAREKAIRNAKVNIFKVRRGCGSWECACGTPHSIPFSVTGKCGSVEVTFMSAPKGKGLVAELECKTILKMAGIEDIWAKTRGQSKTKINMISACIDALKKLSSTKIPSAAIKQAKIEDGPIRREEQKNE